MPGEIAQPIKALATKTEELSLIPAAYMVVVI